MRTYLKILEELDWPSIFMIESAQFEKVEGDSIKGNYGISSIDKPVITIKGGIRGRVLKNTIYHEIAHHLFPNKKHWWIECAAERLACGGGRGYWSVKPGEWSRASCGTIFPKTSGPAKPGFRNDRHRLRAGCPGRREVPRRSRTQNRAPAAPG